MKFKRIVGWTVLLIPLGVLTTGVIAYWRSDNSCSVPEASAPANPMKAWVYCDYGTPKVLAIKNIERPTPSDSQVLIRVRAAALNPMDWHYVRGTPYIMRLESGMRKPKVTRLGVDFAGTVETVGRSVTRFKVGDDVFGGKTGAFAEFIVLTETGAVAHLPANVSYEQAATVGIAAITALQGLRDAGRLQAGHRVLINGSSGGVGTFAVQIAKAMGAHVTGVNSTRNIELVQSLGADSVIDYTKFDYSTGAARYDIILDNVGNRALSDNRRVLVADGRYVLIGGGGPDAGNWVGPLIAPIKALLVSPFVSQHLSMYLASLNQTDLNTLGDLMASGKMAPVIDRTFPFAEVPAALEYLETGRARGKVVIGFESPTPPVLPLVAQPPRP